MAPVRDLLALGKFLYWHHYSLQRQIQWAVLVVLVAHRLAKSCHPRNWRRYYLPLSPKELLAQMQLSCLCLHMCTMEEVQLQKHHQQTWAWIRFSTRHHYLVLKELLWWFRRSHHTCNEILEIPNQCWGSVPKTRVLNEWVITQGWGLVEPLTPIFQISF